MTHRIDDRCNGCSACARQCPTEAIFVPREGRYAIEPRRCIDCGVCGLVCPVEAVVDAQGTRIPRLPRASRLRPVVDADLCIGCGLCVDFCPFDCLALEGRRHAGISALAVPLACVSCGECRVICIKGAIRMQVIDVRAARSGRG